MFLVFVLIHSAVSEITYLAVSSSKTHFTQTHFTIPSSSYIAQQIEEASANYTTYSDNILPGDSLVLNRSDNTQQFHGILENSQGPPGRYYSVSSVVTTPCVIQEQSDIFFEQIPRNFTAGLPAIIPCLVTGLPSPVTTIYRCLNKEECNEEEEECTGECTEEEVSASEGFKHSKDGHIVITNSTASQSGWYRCVGTNTCGSVTSPPLYINISSDHDKDSGDQSGYLISRRTQNSSFTHHIEERSNSDYENKEVSRTLTELQLWSLDTVNRTYSDEVLYLSNKTIHLFYYPTHTSSSTGFNQLTSSDYLTDMEYGVATHNNSYVTQFSKSSYTDKSSWATILTYSTEILSPPKIIPANNVIMTSSTKLNIVFSTTIHETYRHMSNVRCYRNTVRLQKNWKTGIRITDRTIEVTLDTLIKLDSGYYQCGVLYDVLYISKPVYVDVIAAIQDNSSVSTTSTSAEFSWDGPAEYSGEFVVFVSRLEPFPVNNNSVTLHNLIPYTNYSWYITTPQQTPLVDMHTFRTRRAVPVAVVGNISVVRTETSFSLGWEEVPREEWFDAHIYFSIHVTSTKTGSLTKILRSDSDSVKVLLLSPATTYNISVSVCNTVGCSDNASHLTALTKHTVITATPTLRLIYLSRDYADLEVWSVPDGATTFLYISPGQQCQSDSPDSAVKISTPRARADRLSMSTWYSIRVQTTNGYSKSPWSQCISFQTKFDWLRVVVPLCCLVLVIVLGVILRATVRHRYPDLFNKLRQALEPRYMPVILPGDEWETSNDVKIIHTKTETCAV